MALLALAPAASAIYGGAPADEGEYPWMVELRWADGLHLCGGSLIAPTLVLTAAHCTPSEADAAFASHDLSVPGLVWGETWDGTVAVVGATDREDPQAEVLPARAFHRHPLYHVPGYFTNDIAIVELAAPSTRAPVAFARADHVALYAEGADARVIGWGCTETTCEQRDLLEVGLPSHTDAFCKARPNELVRYDPPTMVCAGAPGRDSCGGDSGGPLFLERDGAALVYGIVSYGPIVVPAEADDPAQTAQVNPCGSEEPGVYTEVAAYETWIAGFLG